MPNWKKVIVSGSDAILDSVYSSGTGSFLDGGVLITSSNGAEIYVDGNITASGDISGSGALYASLSLDDSNYNVVIYDTDTGQFYYTGSYSGGGGGGGGIDGVNILDTNIPVVDEATDLDFTNAIVTDAGGGEANIAFDLNGVSLNGETAVSGGRFFHNSQLQYGWQLGPQQAPMRADSGFRENSGKAYTHVTPQSTPHSFHMLGALTNASPFLHEYPNNHIVYAKGAVWYGVSGDYSDGGGGGTPGGTQEEDYPNDGGGMLIINGGGIHLTPTESQAGGDLEANPLGYATRGMSLHPTSIYFYNTDASSSISGSLLPVSSSVRLKFDTGSSALKFFVGDTATTAGGESGLTEALFISRSGNVPRVGIGKFGPGSGDLTTDKALYVSGSTEVSRDVSVGNAFDVTGTTNLNGSTNVNDVLTIKSTTEFQDNVTFVNNTGVRGKDTSNSPVDLIKVNTSNEIELGNTSDNIKLRGHTAFVGDLTASQALRIESLDAFLPELRTATANTMPGSNDTLMFMGTSAATNRQGGVDHAAYPDNFVMRQAKIGVQDIGNTSGGGGGGPAAARGGSTFFAEVEAFEVRQSSGSSEEEGNKSGILFKSNPSIYFFNTDASSSVSGSLLEASASSQIKFDTGSSALTFFAGDTTTDLVEVMHVSRSGINPRIGIGTTDPKTVFDFKDVEDSTKGTELLLRSARSAEGALAGDEGGSINFTIDSGSYIDLRTSGSLAKIKTKVTSVTEGGAQGKLAFELSRNTGGETKDIFEYGYAIGGQGLFAAVQTASLVIRDWSNSGTSTFQMLDSTNTTRFSIDKGDISASGSLIITGSTELSGSTTVSGSFTVTDLLTVLADYGQTGSFSVSGSSTLDGDVDMNGVVNVNDVLTVLAGFGASGSNTITGSLEISGSGGRHALSVTGSTELSGSTTVSGSFTVTDLLTVLADYGQTGSFSVSGSSTLDGDVDMNGEVNVNDLLTVLAGMNVSGSNTLTGSLEISGSGRVLQITGSSDFSGNVTFNGDITSTGNLTVDGDITANQYIVSSSVTYMTQSFSSGSTIFGDTLDDTHQFTGSINVTGSITTIEEITSNTFETISTTLASDSATNVDTFDSSSYNGAIYDYILKDTGVGARAGQFMVAHDGGSVTFTDTSTKHLTDSTIPEITADINNADVRVRITNGNGYTFKSFVKKL